MTIAQLTFRNILGWDGHGAHPQWNIAKQQSSCPVPKSPLFMRLEKHGEHIHHLAFSSLYLENTFKKLKTKGVALTATISYLMPITLL